MQRLMRLQPDSRARLCRWRQQLRSQREQHRPLRPSIDPLEAQRPLESLCPFGKVLRGSMPTVLMWRSRHILMRWQSLCLAVVVLRKSVSTLLRPPRLASPSRMMPTEEAGREAQLGEQAEGRRRIPFWKRQGNLGACKAKAQRQGSLQKLAIRLIASWERLLPLSLVMGKGLAIVLRCRARRNLRRLHLSPRLKRLQYLRQAAPRQRLSQSGQSANGSLV